jgi:hypothetical protein
MSSCREQIASFSDINFDGESAESPFANSLTMTRDDFSNYFHCDNDAIAIAYGFWWIAEIIASGKSRSFTLNPNFAQSNVKGGAFVVGEYKVGIDFEKYVTSFTF